MISPCRSCEFELMDKSRCMDKCEPLRKFQLGLVANETARIGVYMGVEPGPLDRKDPPAVIEPVEIVTAVAGPLMLQCSCCGGVFPESRFHRRGRGRQGYCKVCQVAKVREYKARRKEQGSLNPEGRRMVVCVKCGQRRLNRSHGLCQSCYAKSRYAEGKR